MIVTLLATIALHMLAIGEHAASLASPEYGEGPLAAFVSRWIQEPPGPTWSGVPFTGMPYGPLMLAEWRAAAILWPDTNLVLLGRVVALIATTVLVLTIAGVVLSEQRSAASSLVAVTLMLA